MLCDAMLCYAMLCYAVLCYAVLCYGVQALDRARTRLALSFAPARHVTRTMAVTYRCIVYE